MNVPFKGFRIFVGIGLLVNAAFWGPALFAPQMINETFGLDPNYYTVWLRNVGMVLLLVSITNAAAAIDPVRYRLFAWLVVVGRLIAALPKSSTALSRPPVPSRWLQAPKPVASSFASYFPSNWFEARFHAYHERDFWSRVGQGLGVDNAQYC